MDLNTINNPFIGFSVNDNIQIIDIISDLTFENKTYEIRKQDNNYNWTITEKANFFEWNFKIYNNQNENWFDVVSYLLSLNTGKKLYFKPYFDNVKTYDVYATFELIPAQNYDYIDCKIMRATKDSKLVGDVTITVLKPITETINIGDSYVIEWESQNIGANETVKIELWKNDLYDSLIAQEVTNDGTYTWSTLGLTASTLYKIKIIYEADTNVYDFSSQFILAQKSLTVTLPNGGESITVGNSYNITWTSQNIGSSENIKIELYKNNALDSTITASTANDGLYSWNTTGLTVATDYKIKISLVSDSTVNDISNANFTIASGATNWTPANTTTALWLDANDLTTITKDGSNLVSQWNDKSGNSKNATATGTGKPLWSSGKLSFDGSDDFMVTPSITMGQPVTLFIVASVNTLSGDRTIVNNQYGDTLKPFQQYINSSGRLIEWRAGGYVSGVQTNTIFQITEQQPSLNRINMWINGNAGTSSTATSYYPDNTSLYIGKAQSFGEIGWLYGDIHEICLYIGTITDELIYNFQGYFAWKWDGINGDTALVTALASNHPYKSAPPTT